MNKQFILRRMFRNIRPEGFAWPVSLCYNRLSLSSIYQHHYELVAKEAMAMCPEGKLLDVGTGPGRLLIAIRNHDSKLSLSGIDLSSSMVEEAKANLAAAGVTSDVEVKVGNSCHIPYPNNTFDIVVSTASLHRWSKPIDGLNEVYRVLKPNGHALIYDIVHDTPFENRKGIARAYGRIRLGLFWFRGFAESFYSQDELCDLARQTTFKECHLSFTGLLCRMTLFKMGFTSKA